MLMPERPFADWIKMRDLTNHPKVIAMSRHLQDIREFREWLTPGGGSEINGQLVRNEASRCCVTSLLLRVWICARKHGKFDGDDLVLEHNCIADLDGMAGVPGFGEAMESVGWAIQQNGVTLPNFKDCNVPLTGAERQQLHRDRIKEASHSVTKTSRAPRNESNGNVTLEKSRVENTNTPLTPLGGKAAVDIPSGLDTTAFRLAWDEWNRYRAERRKKLTPSTVAKQLAQLAKLGEPLAIRTIERSIAAGWTGLFPPDDAGTTAPAAALDMDYVFGRKESPV